MGQDTSIEWTEATWNPIRGCSRISQGCVNCYAEKVAARFSGPGLPYEGLTDKFGRWNGVIRTVPEHLLDPMRWQRPRMVFVNSMSDLFHHSVDLDVIESIFGVMALAQRHTFQVLTKRAGAMRGFMDRTMEAHAAGVHQAAVHATRATDGVGVGREYLNIWGSIDMRPAWPLPNVWLGVSVEDDRVAERIDILRATPAAVRWLSVEPLIGPLNLHGKLDGIDWVVVGGESGPGARECYSAWIADVLQACKDAGVPVFVKQLGAAYSDPINGLAGVQLKVSADAPQPTRRLKHPKGGDMAEWPPEFQVRQWPKGGAR
jgi:protein gp37